MNQSKFKVELKRDAMEAMSNYIIMLINKFPPKDDDDKLLYSTLSEIRLKMEQKLLNVQSSYTMSLPATQALALRIMYNDYTVDTTSYLGNKLHQIANQVHKQYS